MPLLQKGNPITGPSFTDRDLIQLYAEDPDVDWYLDTNMVLGTNVKNIVGREAKLFVTEKVASEVRKHSEGGGPIRLLDQIESNNRIVNDQFFGAHSANFSILTKLCETLTPIAREFREKHGEDEWERATQAAAHNGTFFEPVVLSDDVLDAQNEGSLPPGYISLHPKLRRAWFSYHAKRAQRIACDNYIFADEQLVAAAACNSLVLKRKTAILSNDRDLAVIIKNLRDNTVLSYSRVVCEEQGFDATERMWGIFEHCCNQLNEFEQTESLKLNLEIQPTDLPIYWDGICHLNHYRSSPFFVNFLAQEFSAGDDPVSTLERLLVLPPDAA